LSDTKQRHKRVKVYSYTLPDKTHTRRILMIFGNGSVAFEFNVNSNIYYIGIFDAKNMKVLVLGHKGWIGGKICDILSRRQIDYVVTLNIRGED